MFLQFLILIDLVTKFIFKRLQNEFHLSHFVKKKTWKVYRC